MSSLKAGTDPGFGKRAGGGAVDRGQSPSSAGGSGGMSPANFEHLESLKWHFLHTEKAKCLILQFPNNKILPFSE